MAAPNVVGQSESGAEVVVKAESEQAELYSKGSQQQRRKRLAISVAMCIVVMIVQGAVFNTSSELCVAWTMTRLQRVAWLTPLYFLAPWSAVGLLLIFVHDPERFSYDVPLHRWARRFAFWNLLACLFAGTSELHRDCSNLAEGMNHSLYSFGRIGEVLWVFSYTISEGILLFLVHSKVRSFGQNMYARTLHGSFACMLLWVFFMFAPLSFWSGFRVSPLRAVAGLGLMISFAVSTAIATRAVLVAVKTAELEAARRDFLAKSWFHETTEWARMTAFAIFASMSSCTLLQLALFAWMLQHYPPNSLRIFADWVTSIDFIMNAWCVACVSGMIGPKADLLLPEQVDTEMSSA